MKEEVKVMPTHKVECPICKKVFTHEHIHLVEKKKKEITGSKELEALAPKVNDLLRQLGDKAVSIKKITIIAANKENQLQQTDNPGYSLEVHLVPGLEPKP